MTLISLFDGRTGKFFCTKAYFWHALLISLFIISATGSWRIIADVFRMWKSISSSRWVLLHVFKPRRPFAYEKCTRSSRFSFFVSYKASRFLGGAFWTKYFNALSTRKNSTYSENQNKLTLHMILYRNRPQSITHWS